MAHAGYFLAAIVGMAALAPSWVSALHTADIVGLILLAEVAYVIFLFGAYALCGWIYYVELVGVTGDMLGAREYVVRLWYKPVLEDYLSKGDMDLAGFVVGELLLRTKEKPTNVRPWMSWWRARAVRLVIWARGISTSKTFTKYIEDHHLRRDHFLTQAHR